MDKTLTKDFLKEMTSSALGEHLKIYLWGDLPAESIQSDLVDEVIERLKKDVAACVTEAKREENLIWASQSYWAALKGKKIHCRGCSNEFPLVKLFRCYHCGSYFCPKCAMEHFGARAEQIKVKGAA